MVLMEQRDPQVLLEKLSDVQVRGCGRLRLHSASMRGQQCRGRALAREARAPSESHACHIAELQKFRQLHHLVRVVVKPSHTCIFT